MSHPGSTSDHSVIIEFMVGMRVILTVVEGPEKGELFVFDVPRLGNEMPCEFGQTSSGLFTNFVTN